MTKSQQAAFDIAEYAAQQGLRRNLSFWELIIAMCAAMRIVYECSGIGRVATSAKGNSGDKAEQKHEQ